MTSPVQFLESLIADLESRAARGDLRGYTTEQLLAAANAYRNSAAMVSARRGAR